MTSKQQLRVQGRIAAVRAAVVDQLDDLAELLGPPKQPKPGALPVFWVGKRHYY